MGYEIQPWKYKIPIFFTTRSFDTFRNREMSTGGSSIRQQLANLDLRIIIDYSLFRMETMGEKDPIGNEWEDRKVGTNPLKRNRHKERAMDQTNLQKQNGPSVAT